MQDLNDIFLFSAVVSHGGFSAAARALSIPKSQLSKRVARLEEQLGVRLLERSTRAVRVTDIGRAFFEKCESVISGVEAAEAVVAATLTEPRGIVRVSCPPALAKTVLEHALPTFAERYPSVRVDVRVMNRPVDLIEEHIDVAFRARSNLNADPNLMMRVLARGHDVLCASPGLLEQHGNVTIETLAKLPILSPHDGDRDVWRLISGDGQTVEVPVEPRISCNDFDVILASARAGLGVALLPRYVCERDLRSETLLQVLPDWKAPEVIVHLVFTTRRGLPPAVRAFIDTVASDGPDSASRWLARGA